MTVVKPIPPWKLLLRTIMTGANSSMNQSEFLQLHVTWPRRGKKSGVQGEISFGFASHWLRNWRAIFNPITKRSNRNHVINYDSYLKTAINDLDLTWKSRRTRLMLTHPLSLSCCSLLPIAVSTSKSGPVVENDGKIGGSDNEERRARRQHHADSRSYHLYIRGRWNEDFWWRLQNRKFRRRTAMEFQRLLARFRDGV